ncbi:Rz-like spanin [Xanthomonas phage CP1]|uniref:Uncharacterized protein n=1 Tax=Xanthomonas phage CP1 TaxID=2994055 RepID=I7H420_9CAUD|nr:Rz-like spanin [Xanthomonas phage CP1]BAM29101.1 hypothetical protein [Xanthomonas phage CP1]
MLLPVISFARKVELAIGGLLLITVVVLAVQVWMARHRADVTKEELHVASADLGAADVHAQEMRIYYRDREIKNVRVTKAIEANPDWASVELPDDVADQLRNSSGATREIPEPLQSDVPAEGR